MEIYDFIFNSLRAKIKLKKHHAVLKTSKALYFTFCT